MAIPYINSNITISWWSVQQHAEYKLRQDDSKDDDEDDKMKQIFNFTLFEVD